ncbi:hypothetical protein Bca52824_038133 [Brassica carinata]|uniref:TAFII28-like protein domain-containing protein n=2 Tax=Brassica TaxID=3705 RepID=A0A8X7UUN8_BRACI|nr:hypothetical protein Bca52824_038133 [Brassica carinata]
MKHSKEPFEAGIEEEQEEPPLESSVSGGGGGGGGNDDGLVEIDRTPEESERDVSVRRQNKERKDEDEDEDEEEEEENMEAEPELTKYPTTADPAKMTTMQVIFSQFTEDQMSRYESFRRSALQKGNMRKGNDTRNDVYVALKHEPLSFVCFLDAVITGSQKISMRITIVTCGIAKMFVGELVETARVVMGERNDFGPIRPCHIRESYQMLDPISVNRISNYHYKKNWNRVLTWGIMMRYQRVSPDCLPLTNGANKPYLRPSPSNEDTTTSIAAGRGFNGGSCTISSSLDGVPKGFRFRSTQQHDPTPSRSGGGDVLLQWGQRKRSRISRAEIRSSSTTTTPADDSSSSSGQGKTQSNKLSRRSLNPSMPPPAPVFSGRSSNNRNGIVGGKEIFLSRYLEDRSANGSPSRNINSRMVSRSGSSKRSPPSPDLIEKRSSVRDHHQNHRQNGLDHNHDQQHQRVSRSESAAQAHPELETNKNNGEKEKSTQVETREWPRIYIALSRKEKEEDFLVMKGTKLPHRPRKRAKNIDKSLQYCFPGMWLSDLTKNRYEVREKKNVKKQPKRRGLKGLENLDTDSE